MTNQDLGFSYDFSPEEVALLAKFLRGNQERLPDGLFKFFTAVERKIYESLPMKEVRTFYS